MAVNTRPPARCGVNRPVTRTRKHSGTIAVSPTGRYLPLFKIYAKMELVSLSLIIFLTGFLLLLAYESLIVKKGRTWNDCACCGGFLFSGVV